MLALTVTLFGGFEIRGAAGARYDLPGQKERALLAVFALSPAADYSRDWLAGLLWSERENSQARDSLKHAIARLRHCFEPAGIAVIRADRNSVGVNAAAMQIDVVEFENTLKETSIESDARALGLYRGEFLEGISIRDPAFEDWLRIERQRLRNLAEAAATRLMQGALLAGSGERADFAAQRLLSLDPLREDACRALMQLHHAQGETAQALKLFETLRARLRRELGVTPEPETIRLSGAIRHMRGSAASAPATPLTLPERPSIAVMPFRNVRGDPEQD